MINNIVNKNNREYAMQLVQYQKNEMLINQ